MPFWLLVLQLMLELFRRWQCSIEPMCWREDPICFQVLNRLSIGVLLRPACGGRSSPGGRMKRMAVGADWEASSRHGTSFGSHL